MIFDRQTSISKLEQQKSWDVIIIGGGATGLDTAVDSASRGYKTLLLEQANFAKGTSSRSTKLVHGGVRYLAQGDIALVYEALHERSLLFKNAPHLVHDQEFIIPCYAWRTKIMYLIGLRFYDLLAGKNNFRKSSFLSVDQVIKATPGLKREGVGGYYRYPFMLFLDAEGACKLAPSVAEAMAEQLKKNDVWIQQQVAEFTNLVDQYLLKTISNEESLTTVDVKSVVLINDSLT